MSESKQADSPLLLAAPELYEIAMELALAEQGRSGYSIFELARMAREVVERIDGCPMPSD